ncbi:ABC transporter permease [Fictibacillus nanhaiensis]|uniref:ABC transporter permease n=1 Tax=Fictibacillus nanhaiensis TaxID=742169 RepID=UPI0020413A51|nr:ABC transporter permease [Fictibacillus nanhaiensis]MCM3731654.1 ABC transporter permease [Fictibacillus nanhaiensis]
MRQTLLIAHLTVKCWLKQPVPLFAMMLFPLLLLGITYLGLKPLIEDKQWVEPFAVAIVDEDNTFETKLLMKQYEESEELQAVLTFQKTDGKTASEMLADNEIAGMVIVPEGFTNGIRRGKNIPVTVIGNPERPFQAELLQQVMVSNANLISAAQSGANAAFHYLRKMGLSSEEFATYRDAIITDFTLQALNRNKIYETETLSAFSGITPVEFYSLSGVLILLLIGGLFGMSLTARGEQTVLRERLSLQGVRSSVFFFGNILSVFVLLVIQSALLILLFYRVTNTWSLLATGILLTYCLAVSSLFALCQELFERNGAKWGAGILLVVGVTATSGSVLPLSYLPEIWRSVSFLNFMHHTHTGLVEALFSGTGSWRLAGILIGFSIAFWILGILIITIKKRLLWSGQSPLHV